MSLFCKSCNNLLSSTTTAFEFYFKCEQCGIRQEPVAEDTILYEDTKSSNILITNIILKHAADDAVNPKVQIKCTKCNEKYARRIRIGDDMRLIDTCISCQNQILYTGGGEN